MTITFTATRDSARATMTDEDRAMSHENYGRFDTLDDAHTALYVAMHAEADWLTRGDYRSATSLRRAADILDAADKVRELVPADGHGSSRVDMVAAGLRWTVIRMVRPAG